MIKRFAAEGEGQVIKTLFNAVLYQSEDSFLMLPYTTYGVWNAFFETLKLPRARSIKCAGDLVNIEELRNVPFFEVLISLK